MSNSTYATVCIESKYQSAAQADTTDMHFIVGYSSDGLEPVTNYVDSGWWYNEELDTIVNDATWPKQVFFGHDLQTVLADLGLTLVNVEPAEE
jgi:hypothetical protein